MRSPLAPLIPRALVLIALALVSTACRTSTEIGSVEFDDAELAVSTPGPTSAGLPSVDVYATIRDSIVFLETPDDGSSGSGIVLEDGWILTNAHVVDRFAEMRVGRSDGVDLGLHAVHAVDWIFDLALIGPVIDDALVPMERGESSELSIGSRVLLLGFPDEDSATPTPTLTEGIVSRRRFVAVGRHPFLQVDATIAPGQSGGALVDGRGRLVGISGLEFGAGEFGLVLESAAFWPRVDDLKTSTRPLVPDGEAVFSFDERLGPLTNFGFTIDVDQSGNLDLNAASADDIYVDVQTLGGITVSQFESAADPFSMTPTDVQLYIDEQLEGGENVLATMEPGTYQVVVGSFADRPGRVEISSSNPMRRYADAEEGTTLALGEIVEGQFDWSRDTDRWQLPLEAGDRVTVVADGIADVVLAVRLDGAIIASSDDEGLGLFGTGARVEIVADAAGVYEVEVGTYDLTRWGYLLEATAN